MKRTILPFLFLTLAALFPLACNYSNMPYGPSYGGGGGGNRPASTPVPNPTYAVTPPAYLSSWGTAGGPNAVALGAGTTVYVAEADNNVAMVEVFNSASPSTPVTQWTAYGSVSFGWPGGVAVNPLNGNVYVADNVNNAVYEFTPAGVTVASWTGYGSQAFNAPEGIAADASGNIYLADTGNNAVDKFSSSGGTLYQWGSGAGENFYQPGAVAVAGTTLYVADSGNERYLEYNASTDAYLASWDAVTYADIFGLAVDASGNLYAADYGDKTPNNGNGLVEEYDPSNYLSAVWGSSAGSSANGFGPDGVALTATSPATIYVADYNNNLIQVFGP